ncbi:MAG: D-aminoacyl-tRNA deacylase [Gemmatimonadota bacterium]|nr:D-aminoacyl-tRNA deacylase [Gemmatimonadota bacterium]
MRAVVQRVREAAVTVDEEIVGEIGPGLLVLLGIHGSDSAGDGELMARKLVGLRIFSDNEGLMNRSVADVGGSVLLVSQFTLYGDVRKGRRPSFVEAARPEHAEPLVEHVAETIRSSGVPVKQGRFGAKMAVSLTNDGPVTIVIEIPDR